MYIYLNQRGKKEKKQLKKRERDIYVQDRQDTLDMSKYTRRKESEKKERITNRIPTIINTTKEKNKLNHNDD